jgi:hypothetical protein
VRAASVDLTTIKALMARTSTKTLRNFLCRGAPQCRCAAAPVVIPFGFSN